MENGSSGSGDAVSARPAPRRLTRVDAARLAAEGWTPLPLAGFSEATGPYWTRGKSETRELAMVAEQRHTNSHRGTVHGGALTTLADVCLGIAAADALGGPRCVTAQLQMQFVAAGRIGQLLVARAEIVRRTRHLVFMRGLITAGGSTVASADGIWKALVAED